MYPILLKDLKREENLRSLCDGTLKPETYTWFILIELIPRMHKLRVEGKLTFGRKKIQGSDGTLWEYEGEIYNGMAYGLGKRHFCTRYHEGMFVDDKPHGFGK